MVTPVLNENEESGSRGEGMEPPLPRRSERLKPKPKCGPGTVIRKQFDVGKYLGTVIQVLLNAERTKGSKPFSYPVLYKISYEDGDAEEFSEKELEEVEFVKKIEFVEGTAVDLRSESEASDFGNVSSQFLSTEA